MSTLYFSQRSLYGNAQQSQLKSETGKIYIFGMEWIYFVAATPYDGFVKIGKTGDLKNRLVSIQSGNPYYLVFYGLIHVPVEIDLEKRVHRKFASHRHRGEWFKMEKKDLSRYVRLLYNTYHCPMKEYKFPEGTDGCKFCGITSFDFGIRRHVKVCKTRTNKITFERWICDHPQDLAVYETDSRPVPETPKDEEINNDENVAEVSKSAYTTDVGIDGDF